MSIFTLYFIAGQVIWGFLPAFWKSLSALDPVYILSARIVFSTLVCGAYVLATAHRREFFSLLHAPALLGRLALASLFITANWGLYITAVNTGRIFDAGLAYFINPILCLLFSSLLFRERMNGWQKAAALTAAAGIAAAFLLYGSIPWFALIMCSPFAVYSVIKKKMTLSGMVTVFTESLFMTVPSLLYMGFCETEGRGAFTALSGWEWGLLPLTGILTAFPMALFSAGLRGISFSAASILMYLSPAIQVVLAAVYGETLSPIMLVNFAFVLAAVALYIVGSIRKSREVREAIRAANRK